MPTRDHDGMYETSTKNLSPQSPNYTRLAAILHIPQLAISTRRIDVAVAVYMLEMYGRPLALVRGGST